MTVKLIKLTKEQKRCVEFTSTGELLIQGIPGSGKTTVVMERAIHLQNQENIKGSNLKVVLLTYNRALSTYICQMAKETDDKILEALTFHQWGAKLLKGSGISIGRLISDEKYDKVRFAKNIINKYGDPDYPRVKVPRLSEEKSLIMFLSEEIAWIKHHNIKSRQEYLTTPRIGRGTQVQVNKTHRETIYDVYEKYQSILKGCHTIDFDDIALLLLDNINNINSELRPVHILIDEAQDLTPSQFYAIKRLAIKSITIAADKGQQIYRRNFTWKSVGIEIRGSRNKVLNRTFRSTKQIIRLARSLQQYDVQLQNDNEFLPAEDPDAIGPKPELIVSTKSTEELEAVIKQVCKLQNSFPYDTIAIIAYSEKRLSSFEGALAEHNIGSIYIKSDEADFITPGVKLVTFHSSKGLEFDHVIVTGLKNGILPYALMEPGDDPEDFKTTERRKLFVAMTRARLTLTLSSVEPMSSFISELDPELYQRK